MVAVPVRTAPEVALAPRARASEVPLDLDVLYRRYAPLVGRWAIHLGGPSVDAEDVVQEVFLAAQRARPTERSDARATTWLYRTTENIVRHQRRRNRVRRWLSGLASDVAGDLPAAEPQPLESVEARQARERVYAALDGMKERERNVFILFEIEELSGQAIAEMYGAKPATVWVWLHRARAVFHRRLAALEEKEGSNGT